MPLLLPQPSPGSAASPRLHHLSCFSFPICLIGESSAKQQLPGAPSQLWLCWELHVWFWGQGTWWGRFSHGAGSLGVLLFPKARDILPCGFSGEGTRCVCTQRPAGPVQPVSEYGK